MQYVIVNGMPYLVPAVYLPILQHQHYLQQAQLFSPYMYYGAPVSTNLDGTTFFYPHPHAMMGDQAQAAPRAGPGAAAGAADPNAQDIVARDQRRAASLWLLMKLAFGVYVFSQNGSIERIVLLHIAALVIFLHQTGRLRIVRRIGNPPGDAPQEQVVNAGQQTQAVNGQARAATTTSTSTATPTTSSDGTHVNNNNPMNDQQGQSSSSTSVHGSNGLTAAGSSSHSQPVQNPAAASAGTSAASLDGSNAPGAQTQQAHDTTQQQPQPRVSTWRSIEHALLTFVTSLVPAPPPEIDQAVANAAAGERGL
ncbi:hypothetical protein BGZ98_009771 [Dissophora globulifera]|nr:hypothetical protein BGZ98_009771 [Dissophora globulifera]